MKPKKRSLYIAMACLWALAILLAANGAASPRPSAPVPPPDARVMAAAAMPVPVAPMALVISVGIPMAAGALSLRAAARARRRPPVCPACASHRGARVGQVGDHRNAYRCHTCGFLWEIPPPFLAGYLDR